MNMEELDHVINGNSTTMNSTADRSEHSGAATPPLSVEGSPSSSGSSVNSNKSGAGELLNTSSFARRLAHGKELTKQDPELSRASSSEHLSGSPYNKDREGSEDVSFDQCPKDGISASIKQEVYFATEDETTDTATSVNTSDDGGAQPVKTIIKPGSISSAPKSEPDRKAPSATPPRSSQSSNDNPFGAFGEYVAFFFQKAEVYEEELELRQSQRNLQMEMDRVHHGKSHRNLKLTPEGGGGSSSEDDSLDGKNDALDAMSNFRNLSESQRKLKKERSCDEEPDGHKKQRVGDGSAKGKSEVVDESIKIKEEWKQQWKTFVAEKKKNKFEEVLIESLPLELSVDEFYHHVLQDTAIHSISKFMVDIGELKVVSTPWVPPETPTATEPATRTICYTHPVNAPMAPPTAKANKEQILHKIGSFGLCLETCTVVEEVPMADCFVVNDRLWVNEAEGGNGCVVSVTFQIKFVKGTMFRRIIENTTRKEYESFWNQFADMIKSLQSPLKLEEEELEDVATELERATSMLEGEGTEIPLRSTLSRIRQSSRRLTEVAKLESTKKVGQLETVEEKPGIDWQTVLQRMLELALDVIEFIRKFLSESDDNIVVACGVIFLLLLLNMIALKQMMTMNRFLGDLDGRLGQMNELNQMLLAKLASENTIDAASCSG